MKVILAFLFAFLIHTCSTAQDTWKVVHNGKQLLKTANEDEAKNIIVILKSDLKKDGYLMVNYSEAKKQNGWKRAIIIFDEKDSELVKQSGSSFKITNQKLNALANGRQMLKIYTIALPADPKLAATIRIRRIHLCTITFT
ncbi:MAG: hypothetical protein ICV51_05880 [Flavisolibacter sp.]|nr:hypothetical protein [Flavisolibacter sp.]MBD0375141.1 hypothetical protein [Flavisolibacter sp.]